MSVENRCQQRTGVIGGEQVSMEENRCQCRRTGVSRGEQVSAEENRC